jgi:hypothetical protein
LWPGFEASPLGVVFQHQAAELLGVPPAEVEAEVVEAAGVEIGLEIHAGGVTVAVAVARAGPESVDAGLHLVVEGGP